MERHDQKCTEMKKSIFGRIFLRYLVELIDILLNFAVEI